MSLPISIGEFPDNLESTMSNSVDSKILKSGGLVSVSFRGRHFGHFGHRLRIISSIIWTDQYRYNGDRRSCSGHGRQRGIMSEMKMFMTS